MQNLRDKLLKAGVVKKKQARRAKAEVRKARKQGLDPTKEQRQAQEQKRKQAAEQERMRIEEQRAVTAAQEHQQRLRLIIEPNRVKKIRGDDERFHFVGPDNKIRRLYTNRQTATALRDGKIAIVSAPYDELRDYRLVDKKTARRVAEIDESAVLFFNDPTQA